MAFGKETPHLIVINWHHYVFQRRSWFEEKKRSEG